MSRRYSSYPGILLELELGTEQVAGGRLCYASTRLPPLSFFLFSLLLNNDAYVAYSTQMQRILADVINKLQ